MQYERLSGEQKAAILLISLGADISSKILKYDFTEEEVERITASIAEMDKVPNDIQEQVVQEFVYLIQARDYLINGGVSYAKELLEKTYGYQKSAEILERISSTMQSMPFSSLRKSDPRHILSFIKDEHPQTIAFVLSYLKPDQAAVILSELDPQMQSEVARRVAILDRISPDVAKEVEKVLEKKLSTVAQHEETVVGGIQCLVNILNRVDRATEKTIFDHLERMDPNLSEEVRRMMFIFEDIVKLHDISIQKVLREVDNKDLALAMKGANQEVNNRIYKNMSKRAADMLKEEIEYMGPVRLKDVEEAQQRIVNVIRRLEEAGEIVISRGGEDAIIV
ncbi:flagellar motor switch protein FliG [Desulfotomaculum nigrificans CO-1-SRB]|uniref:Flagellar motor switch protein FliG n=1 Tax=Desulfotomaculum nigrificans (strain DSM 14880 / VKM B-2319 / CO-1-SRB) TaxID=868595 RepID=F6B807_DESCC|nr:flagellar motor switch protein FliG [Desulfotomaculum nigrificans]AEF94644.1 flagellar motor switch protein FliG [Desulfotomaculum nigrificans CO-1-SRB]